MAIGGASMYSIREIGFRLMYIIFPMGGYEPFLLGAYWFMRSLFWGSLILAFFSLIISKRVNNNSYAIFICCIIFFSFAGVKAFLQKDVPFFPGGGYPEMMSVVFISIGFFIKNMGFLISHYVFLFQ